MSDHVQTSMFVVQTLGLFGLLWYTVETRKMRKAAQEQAGISQSLINAAMDQVEGLSKPCLTIWADSRNTTDAILEMDGAIGNMIACADRGSFVVQNIGNGVALNVNYTFVPIGETASTRPQGRTRYVQNVLATQKIVMVEPMSAYNGDFNVIFRYHSIGGRKYQTTVTMNNLVLTAFVFATLKS